MAVSGLPEACENHAKWIAKLALDMMDMAKYVQMGAEPVVSLTEQQNVNFFLFFFSVGLHAIYTFFFAFFFVFKFPRLHSFFFNFWQMRCIFWHICWHMFVVY